MRKKILLKVILLLLISVPAIKANHLQDNLLVAAAMDGSQEVPFVNSTALGVAALSINATRDSICLKATVTGLSGPITAAHIHEGDPGVSGGVVIDLSSFIFGNNISATLTGPDVSSMNISKLLSGKFYINVHTAANPNGEIRGQLYLETDWSFPVMLDGSQEVPSVATSAYGVGSFNLSKDLSKLTFNVVVQGLSGPITASHLQAGAAGVSGGIVEDLSAYINGNMINGTLFMPSLALIDSMRAGNIYLNVHTTANPDGEIRSQLTNENSYIYFDAMLNGDQEVPPVTTFGKGAATIKLNTTFDTLWYDVAIDSLSGPITASHFHQAFADSSGGVVEDITSSVIGNRITGTVTGISLTPDFISELLKGEIYVNAHTSLNPGGEIRGQVYSLVRDGFTFSMDGSQETPPVSTSASGTGIVSIDRDHENLHFMIVADGITPTAAHFHNNVVGQSSGVIFDLSPFLINNGAFGYWRNTDANSFTPENASLFFNDSVYANVHTATNPGGEIRGQVNKGFQCYDLTIGINENDFLKDAVVSVYPNPASEILNLDLTYENPKPFRLSLLNILGKEVYTNEIKLNKNFAHFEIDTKEFATGIYIVKIQNEDGQLMMRFVKD
jgi:hypothetical protein